MASPRQDSNTEAATSVAVSQNDTLAAAIQQQTAVLAELIKIQSSGGGMTADQFQKILNAQRQAVNPSNADHLHISDFSYPEGDLERPKPRLKREIFMNGFREDEDCLRPEEIETYNRLSDALPGPNSKRTARLGKYSATVSADNLRIVVLVPTKSIDDARDAPSSLVLLLRELIDGSEAVNPFFLLQQADRVKVLEATIAQMQASIESLTAQQAQLGR